MKFELNSAQQLSLMIKLAAEGHKDQFDKGGRPYILHVLKVMHYLKSNDDELNCIAVGHDLVEDCGVTFVELAAYGFSERVVDGINRLTKKAGQSHNEYLSGILYSSDACRVKLADLRHNTDIRRLKGLREKDFARMQKYLKMYKTIEMMLEWDVSHRLESYLSVSEYYEHRIGYIEELLYDKSN